MIDIKFLRENPDVVKENIKKKFQDHKLVLVDEVLELDAKNREAKLNGDDLRSKRNSLSSEIGNLMKQGKKAEAESIKAQVQEINNKLLENEKLEEEYSAQIQEKMMKIPNIIHESVPIGKMIVKMLRFKSLENQLFQVMKFHIIQILWKHLKVLT